MRSTENVLNKELRNGGTGMYELNAWARVLQVGNLIRILSVKHQIQRPIRWLRHLVDQ